MLFNSLHFAIFLPIVFGIYWLIPNKYRWFILLLSSYYFYMSWNAKYVVLILGTTLISFFAGLIIEDNSNKKIKNVVLALTLILCLGTLFVFKYLDFFFDSLNQICSLFTIKLSPITVSLILPVGISFYTFQTLSYVIDVYREDIKAERNFGIYAAFISFFPQLVAGPIERTRNLLPQIKGNKMFDYSDAVYGVKLMAWGFFKKMVVADNLAVFVDQVYSNVNNYQGFSLLLATIFFTIQIYCDFSGYSDIARGCAKLFNIKLIENFKSPYFSTTIKEFWSRWHISLSTWFKDYVYIPLGGNRCSKLRRSINLLLTFLVSGLWHGASWTFVLWGGIHGVGQIIENLLGIKPVKSNCFKRTVRIIFVFIFVSLTWVFFRASNFSSALYIFKNMFVGIFNPRSYIVSGLYSFNIPPFRLIGKCLIYIVPLFVFDFFNIFLDPLTWIGKQNRFVRYSIYSLLLILILLFHHVGEVSFIYFQF